MSFNNQPIKPVAMTKTALAAMYKVHPDTFTNWIKPIEEKLGDVIGRIYTPKQVSIIIDHLGQP